MSPVAMTEVSNSPSFIPIIEALRSAPTAPGMLPEQAKAAADRLAREVSKSGPESLNDHNVLKTLCAFATNKKSGYERESAAIAFQSLANILGAPVAPLLLPFLPVLFDLYMDKGDVVRVAAAVAVKSILKLFPPESTRVVFKTLESILEAGKWRTKVGVLDAFKVFVVLARDAVARELGKILPKVEHAMHDTKQEVSVAAMKCATSLCTTLANPDLVPHIPVLVKCMANPDSVPACIKALSSTTFVAEVTAPALAVLVPLMIRALNDRSMEVQRRTVVVIDNLVKLVRNPHVAAIYLSPLVDGVQKIATGAAFPEVRAFGESALQTLLKSGASSGGPPSTHRDIERETSEVLSTLLTFLPSGLATTPHTAQNGPHTPKHALLTQSLEFGASLVADLVHARNYSDKLIWNRCIGVYLKIWSNVETSSNFAEAVRSHYYAIDQAKYTSTISDAAEEGEILCDTLFSLAYGALLLLSHTTLRLVRGRRYGILGANGSGKSTLMRQLRDGKVENFPPQDQLRCVMVEHSLQGEDGSLSVLDFITADKALANISRAKIRDQLLEVGFDDTRQADIVGGLSGGWKMKLELARAMLYNADLLLLDEPTNHLDQNSVKWLEQYLIAHKNVTCLIVSHDSKFLDNVTTDIVHYEKKKLVYYPGNLSKFVTKHPEAKSYYTLAATSVKFSFPPPGSLMGVRSNTRAILKLSGCTFTYPGRTSPSLHNVSCALSLSSRVGIVGPNGAGKSTLVKLLTGETVPQEGTVYKHPALRVGYVSQHATHHIEHHLEKTAIGYIQWRFQDGHDRELVEKATRVLTTEEQAILDTEWVGKDGSKRKLERIMGRQKLKKSFQYEVKWRGLDHKFNTWVSRDDLFAKGFTKLVQQFDDLESSRDGAGSRDTSALLVRKHLEQIGLDGDIAQYNEISGLSGGQKIKLVIAACLWNNPQICVLDEPSNFLDREALGGLAVAIKEWAGAVVIISHNHEFVSELCPETWNVEGGRMKHQGKVAVVEDTFLDARSPKGSGTNTPVRSRLQTPVASTTGTPVGSGEENAGNPKATIKRKKKLTRNQQKAQEERRRLRKLHWLTVGGPKPEDTDSDLDP
ncbi:P-loop containing nucleoside triphosphate hydrolase protein [Collybia nuda]|uniref:Elongation factor 3 n=1 Tax=Collybia nuda TaxID=64659 RepID=A0A9P6CKS6_9AGAR|nr:P-loop containing nucleoside triphosphate hydrolase protein [Collybia nuda]